VSIEVKRQETLALPKWLKQAREGCPKGDVPVLAYRQNGGSWHCLVDMNPIQLAAYMRWRRNLEETEESIVRSIAAENLP
jgi:hypothetical protein